MGWRADSNFRNVGVGTVLTVSFTPHVAGYASPALNAGAQMLLGLGVNAPVKITVIEASEFEIVFELPDGTRWQATPRDETDPPILGVGVPAPSQDWVVRTQANNSLPQSN
jgi:hypothetical protein